MGLCPVENMNVKRSIRQFLPLREDMVFQQMNCKENIEMKIYEDIERDIWKIKKRNRIPIEYANISIYYHLVEDC